MLYLEDQDGFKPWTGQVIGNVRYPPNIEQLWTAADLAALNLYAPVDPGVPEGHNLISTSVARVNGVVQFVHVTEPIPPPVVPDPTPSNSPLTMRQLRLGLVLNGFPVDFIQTAINAIPDVTQRAIATIWYEESIVVQWDHPMTQNLIAAAGLTPTEAATMWMQAKSLEA